LALPLRVLLKRLLPSLKHAQHVVKILNKGL
jgi:hypothetical protein